MGHVFISYSRKDRETVDEIVVKLEKAGLDIWIDRQDIQAGKQWRLEIVRAIDTAESFVLKLSPHSAKSENVRKELDLAEDASDSFVLPVLLQEVQIPPEMRYQLAGTQHISYYLDPEEGYRQLEEVLLERHQAVVLRSGQPPASREVELIIKGVDLAEFDEQKQSKLLAFLAQLTGANAGDLAITRMAAGSLHIFVKMPTDPAYELKAQALNTDPRLLEAGITALRFVGDRRFVPASQAPPATPISQVLSNITKIFAEKPISIWLAILSIAAAIVLALVFGRQIGSGLFPTNTNTLTITQISTRTPPNTATPTSTFTATATPTPSPSATSTATATGTATSTSTPTATATFELRSPWVEAHTVSICRAGPGLNYPITHGDMQVGEEAQIRMKDRGEIWFYVYVERLQINCWVSSGANGTVNVFGDLSQIPIFYPPTSTPTTPSPRLVAPPPIIPTATSTATRTPTPTRSPTYTPSFTPTPQNAAVSGRVWNDANNNAALDGGETLFDNVLVWIESGGCGGTYLNKSITDASGQFSFGNLPAGTYCVNVDTSTMPLPTYGWMCTTQNTNKVSFTLTDGEARYLPFGFYDTLY